MKTFLIWIMNTLNYFKPQYACECMAYSVVGAFSCASGVAALLISPAFAYKFAGKIY